VNGNKSAPGQRLMSAVGPLRTWAGEVRFALARSGHGHWIGASLRWPMIRRLFGAPRSMKMGTIRSPCPYDAATRHALQSVNLRRPAILHYASWTAVFPISQGGPVTPDSGPHDRPRDRRAKSSHAASADRVIDVASPSSCPAGICRSPFLSGSAHAVGGHPTLVINGLRVSTRRAP
jgi:hypothetical protein